MHTGIRGVRVVSVQSSFLPSGGIVRCLASPHPSPESGEEEHLECWRARETQPGRQPALPPPMLSSASPPVERDLSVEFPLWPLSTSYLGKTVSCVMDNSPFP